MARPDIPKPRTDSSGVCEGNCDAATPTYPMVDVEGGHGDVTTYGSVTDPAPSAGGACNYGSTRVTQFAAIQVNLSPGDAKGQWDGGRICGQCAEVRARTPSGWKTTVVRIMDKCPDGFCGIDLGGAPARELMGTRPGRYSGEWTWVSCEGLAGVSDGPPALFVKEGSNPFWSLIQIRNPPERVVGIRMRRKSASASQEWSELPWAAEAENFLKVPEWILQDTSLYELEVRFPSAPAKLMTLKGSALAAERSTLGF